MEFKTLSVTNPEEFVFLVELNRPEKYNAFNKDLWCDLGRCFDELAVNPDCRAIVLAGAGKNFSTGLDFAEAMRWAKVLAGIPDVARKGHFINREAKEFQDSISAVERCHKPVIGASHGAVIGAGVDLFCAVDVRMCTKDCWYQAKEVDIGMAADVGTLQRLPKVIGSQSLARELCLTGRKWEHEEALSSGFVSKVFETREEMMAAAIAMAKELSAKSPIAVQATKKSMVYSLDHTVQEGLDHIREMNSLLLQSEDFTAACTAMALKMPPPPYPKL